MAARRTYTKRCQACRAIYVANSKDSKYCRDLDCIRKRNREYMQKMKARREKAVDK